MRASQLAVQRDPRWFDDPLEFRPGRWVPGYRESLPRFAFFRFGGGSRQRVGDRFSLMAIRPMMARMGQDRRAELPAGYEMELFPAVSLDARGGLPIHRPRRN